MMVTRVLVIWAVEGQPPFSSILITTVEPFWGQEVPLHFTRSPWILDLLDKTIMVLKYAGLTWPLPLPPEPPITSSLSLLPLP